MNEAPNEPESGAPKNRHAIHVPPPDVLAPDGKPFGEGKYIGLTALGLPVPAPRPSPANTITPWEGRTDEYRAGRDAYARYRNSQRKASRRPGWWNPNGVMDRLLDGEHITDLIQEAVKDCGGRVKMRILYRELAHWKRVLPAFKRDYERATNLYDRDCLPEKHWDAFFRAMREAKGKMEHACAMLKIGQKVVLGMLDPAFKGTYNKKFAERYRLAELERMAPIRARLLDGADSDDADPKVQLAVLENALPALHGKKKTVAVEGGIDLRLEAAAAEQQTARERALFAGREPKALPAAAEPITIDVTALAVKGEAS